MVRFACTEPRRTLFRCHPTPNAVYSAAYGPRWWEMSEAEYIAAYERHDARVRGFFQRGRGRQHLERFLELG